MREFAVRNRLSIWLNFVILMVASTMMHPTFSSLVAIFMILILLFINRWVAHVEGAHQGV